MKHSTKEIMIKVFPIMLFLMLFQYAESQIWSWARTTVDGATTDVVTHAILTNPDGTSYVTGIFTGTVMFDEIEKTNQGYNFFLAKLNTEGKYIWVTTSSHMGSSSGRAISTDPAGNIYVTGTFTGVDGHPGLFGTEIGSSSDGLISNSFISRFSPNGNLQWSSFIVGTDYSINMVLACKGNTLSMAADYGTKELTIHHGDENNPPFIVPNSLSRNSLLVTFDIISGELSWAKTFGNNIKFRCTPIDMVLDTDQNIYLSGKFTQQISIDDTTLTSANGSIFVLKVSPSGPSMWVSQINSQDNQLSGLNIDADNNILAIGIFSNFIEFDDLSLSGLFNKNIFWVKYNPNGTPTEAKIMGGGVGSFASFRTTKHEGGNFFAVGGFSGLILGNDNLQPVIPGTQFVFKVSNEGEISWAYEAYTAPFELPRSIGVDNSNNFYMVGYLFEEIVFGNYVVQGFWGDDINNDYGYVDAYISKFEIDGTNKYVFLGNGLWSTPENWEKNKIPGDIVFQYDTVIIASSPQDSCFLDIEVYFEPGSFLHINEGSRFIIENDFNIMQEPDEQEDSTFTDPRDRNVYTIKRYGNQVWMTQDLRYGGGTSENGEIYGSFYGWPNPGNSQENPAPPGWHVPSAQEWQTLIDFFGGKAVAGGALKDTLYWDAPNLGATNSSGFNARGGGLLNESFEIEALGEQGFWWTSTVGETQTGTITRGTYISMGKNGTGVGSDAFEIYLGLKIRCVKD